MYDCFNDIIFHNYRFIQIRYHLILVPFTVYSYKVKCLVGTTLTECGENLPCSYQSNGGTIAMKCGTTLQPNLDKVKCHSLKSDDYKTTWRCYCKTEGCNHKCEYKKDPCKDTEITLEDGTKETHKVCDGTCMAKNTGVMSPTMTMKTMMTEKAMMTEKTMGPTKQPGVSTTKAKVSGPNEMGTTSKSSNTNAAAFYVLVGMVILTTKHFL